MIITIILLLSKKIGGTKPSQIKRNSIKLEGTNK